ncbi:kinase-like domain, phloem protein 2-like protein [Tanacetum coccineum]
MLSPDTEYVCNLLFKLSENCRGMHCPVKVRDVLHQENKEAEFLYFITPEPSNIHDITRVPKQREDGWMEIQLWKFNSAHEFKDDSLSMNMRFTSLEGTMPGLIVIMATSGKKKAVAEPVARARDPRDVETIKRLLQRIQEIEFQRLQQDSPADETKTESNVWDDGSEDGNHFGRGNPSFLLAGGSNLFVKKEEMNEKLKKFREIAGIGDGEDYVLDERDLEGDFYPDEYDRKMKKVFDDDQNEPATENISAQQDIQEELPTEEV